MSKAYVEARKDHGSSELLDDIVSEQPSINAGQFGSIEEVREQAPQRLRAAVDLLEQKATREEVEDYKRFVIGLAQRIASAHKEGGVLGIGGTEISDDERVALDEIASTLGVTESS